MRLTRHHERYRLVVGNRRNKRDYRGFCSESLGGLVTSTATGSVYLVGAGPGDPDLLTVRASRLLEDAEVILHDSLVDPRIIEKIPPPGTTVIDVGKRPGQGRRWRQDEINRCMAKMSEEMDTVVRLKGGDPTVFGRGGEEAEYLAEHGIPFEFVPGVTSAIAAPELAGIPLTHREYASSLTVVTGHEDPTKDESALDWEALASNITAGGTLVILMGVGRLEENLEALRSRGVPLDTPVGVVENAARPNELVVVDNLATVVDRSRKVGLKSPAVVIVGEVVAVRDTLVECLVGTRPWMVTRLPGDTNGSREVGAMPDEQAAIVDRIDV